LKSKSRTKAAGPPLLYTSKNKSPMIDMDEWGKDPSVLAMRKVFKGMEKCLEKILEKLEISPYDQRIRKWLEKALEKFENACGVANQLGIVIDEKNAPAAYAGCLVKVMGSDGIQVPESIFPQYAETERIIQEVFK
jgi:hypothetical protein